MKTEKVNLAQVFEKPVQYHVPLYQRPYVWTREMQWQPLWGDIRDTAERQLDETKTDDDIPHFLGAIVLEPLPSRGALIPAHWIIDGQQRLITVMLLIAAARSIAADRGLERQRDALTDLLFNRPHHVRAKGDEFKLVPTARDITAFRDAVESGIGALTGRHLLHEAYRFFRTSIFDWVTIGTSEDVAADRLDALTTAVWRYLVLVEIDLDPGENAQMIFETLNARGTPLLAADLIKNYLFQLAKHQGESIDALWEEHWHGLDSDWWRDEVQQGRLKRPRLDIFVNHWLAMSSGAEVVSQALFPSFKRYVETGARQAADVLADLARYARVYETFEREPLTTELGQFLYRLRVLEVTTAYPALLWLLGPDGLTAGPDRQAALAAIESWLVRRMLTRQTTKNYNTVFLALLGDVRARATERGGPPIGSDVAAYLAGLRGESQFWPSAGRLSAAIMSLPAYDVLPKARLRMVLEALELGLRTDLNERVNLPTDLTIEHVLPQRWQQHWPLPDGADPLQATYDRDVAKHRLGNLTLITGKLNSSQSNAVWSSKRETLRKHCLLRLASDIVSEDEWSEATIDARGERLADVAIRIWSRPDDTADEEVLKEAEVAKGAIPVLLGEPDPERPDAFARVLSIADGAGVGAELRRIVAVARELGLHPRPDRYSVLLAPPADRRVMLVVLWPQSDDGGSFRIIKSPKSFARFVPGVTLDAAKAALGASEDPGVLFRYDVDALLSAIRSLIPEPLETPGTNGEEEEEPGRVPVSVHSLIRLRAAPTGIDLAEAFAEAAAAIPGTRLKVQRSSTGDPWYYRIRHPKFGQAVAYIHPRPTDLYVEFRLPQNHATYGVATSRDHFYGILIKAHDESELAVAVQLLNDAIARED